MEKEKQEQQGGPIDEEFLEKVRATTAPANRRDIAFSLAISLQTPSEVKRVAKQFFFAQQNYTENWQPLDPKQAEELEAKWNELVQVIENITNQEILHFQF